ncbi:MAG: hypothetical protein U1F54_09165 [Burkholderiales bacterium]
MDPFELTVLGAVANDYEAVHTIRSDLERDLGRPVSENELGAALIRLATAGLVDALVYDPNARRYRRVDLAEHSASELWFFISAHGRAEYERLVA